MKNYKKKIKRWLYTYFILLIYDNFKCDSYKKDFCLKIKFTSISLEHMFIELCVYEPVCVLYFIILSH